MLPFFAVTVTVAVLDLLMPKNYKCNSLGQHPFTIAVTVAVKNCGIERIVKVKTGT
jgi:hypothetical protein